MDNSLKIQMDVKNNAQELRNYMLDLSNWEEEMKKKEIALKNEKPQQNAIPPPRNKIKRTKSDVDKNHSNKPKKISAYDYSAWDKFDAEKACAQVDEEESEETKTEESSDISCKEVEEETNLDPHEENKKFSLIDEAFYEKELGNQFVKKEKWADAIKCYTNAINLDSKNAIYYANRSLCFLKLRNFKSAETDATTAIQLDKNYVKAYQRRAIARLVLGQLTEAKSDYEQILALEPKNALARAEINKIEKKLNEGQTVIKSEKKKTFDHKNIFKSDENKPVQKTQKRIATPKNIDSGKSQPTPPKPTLKTNENKNQTKTEPRETDTSRKNLSEETKSQSFEKGDGDKRVPIRSAGVFRPLPEWCKIVHPVQIPPHKRSKKPLRRIDITIAERDEGIDFAGDAKVATSVPSERIEEQKVLPEPDYEEELRSGRLSLEMPKTAIQFQKCWKIIKGNPEECYTYLKQIPGRELVRIFENSLESDFFSELVTFLAGDDVKKEPEVVYDFLFGLSKVKRFSSLILFMSETDRNCVKKCIGELEKAYSKDRISELITSYELKI